MPEAAVDEHGDAWAKQHDVGGAAFGDVMLDAVADADVAQRLSESAFRSRAGLGAASEVCPFGRADPLLPHKVSVPHGLFRAALWLDPRRADIHV